jgi:O-antigen ligase
MLFLFAGPHLDRVNNASIRNKILPSILALILCTGFVIFLLRLERKQSPEISRVLWIPTIWILYTASKPLGVWIPSLGGDPESGSPVDRVFLIVLICVAFWILTRRGYDWRTAMKENPWLIILITFMLVSILWSNIPFVSFKRWTREFQAVLMAFVVNSEPSPRQAMESILRRTTYILIPFSLLLIKYFPIYGRVYGRWTGGEQWVGVALFKNGLCRLCLISAFFLIWSLVRRWQGHNPRVWKYQTLAEIFVLVITLRLMGGPGGDLTYSATATTALGLGFLVYLGFYLLKKFGNNLSGKALMTIMAIIIVYGNVTFFLGGSSINFYVTTVGRDATLTGRTEIWASLLRVAMQRPILGTGFGGFWTPITGEEFTVSEAHSGYLDVFLSLGFVGMLLVSFFLLSSCQKAHRELSHDFDWAILWICFLIMAAVHNITETSIDTFTSHLTAVVLLFTVSTVAFIRPLRKLS